jgi:hypothetical protein
MIGRAVENQPDLAREIVRRGHEAAADGRTWENSYNLPPDQERQFIRDCADTTIHNGLKESGRPEPSNGPTWTGQSMRSDLERRNDYAYARARYVTMQDWERDDLAKNMGSLLGQCEDDVKQRMLWHLFMLHDDLDLRVRQALGLTSMDVVHLLPLPRQQFTEAETKRLANLGANGDTMDKAPYGKVTGSVENKAATAEEVLSTMDQPEPRHCKNDHGCRSAFQPLGRINY